MDFDLSSVLAIVSFVFANKVVLYGALGVFVGWNLPQPALAKTLQDKVVALVKALFAKLTG